MPVRIEPTPHPQTLGEFQRLDWTLRGGCSRCDLWDVPDVDIAAAVARHGAGYPTRQFMLDLHCEKCGDKMGLLPRSPEQREKEEVVMRGVLAR